MKWLISEISNIVTQLGRWQTWVGIALIGTLEVEAANVGAARHLELADLQDVAALGQFVEHGLVTVQAVARLDRKSVV